MEVGLGLKGYSGLPNTLLNTNPREVEGVTIKKLKKDTKESHKML